MKLSEVEKSYGAHVAVQRMNLSIPAGCIYGFIGPNGSGKTTLLRMILHIIQPDRGTIEVLKNTACRAANDRVGYLPEERGLYRKMTVNRLLTYYGTIKGLSRNDAKQEMNLWLDRMGLADWKKKKIEALSKGMAQKIQFIASVIAKPQLLILDEPFSGLDPVNLDVLRESILELNRNGTTIIFSTHDMAAAEKMCDFIFMIHNGRKVLNGSLDSIREEHGQDLIRLRSDSADKLKAMPGVTFLRDLGKLQEIRYQGDHQQLLKQLLADGEQVEHFEVARPSLHDMFVQIVGEANVPGNPDSKSA